jgi:acyl-CoA dehydrogenase
MPGPASPDHPTPITRRETRSAPPKIYSIFEGTSEIQRLVIARAISGVHIR